MTAGLASRSQEHFREASDVPARLRSRLAHYKNSGFDRGHMAPAGDHRGSEETLKSTFALDNVSPQVGAGFNRDSWARLEEVARDVAEAFCDEAYVVTGPLFLPGKTAAGQLRMHHATLGDPPCVTHVPTHFFKIVLAEKGGSYAIGCFVLPNAPMKPHVDLGDYLVPLDALEAASGVVPFTTLLTPERRAALVAAEAKWLAPGPSTFLEASPIDHDAHHVPKKKRATDVKHLLDVYPRHRLRPKTPAKAPR